MKKLFLLSLVLISISVKAQGDRFTFGFFPEASLKYKISEHYSVTHKFGSRNGLYDSSRLNEEFNYEHILSDLQTFIGRRLSPFVNVDLGYLYRLQEGENINRSIQQVSVLQRESYYRIGHRLRIDQTFFKDAPLLFRVRYRIKGQIPLQGLELDPGEKYLTVSNELLYMIQSSEDDLENRLAAALGFYIDDKNKVEIGFDYRTDDYLVENRFRHRLWFKFGYFKSL